MVEKISKANMMLNLFSRFILWLKKIFHICLKPKYEEKEPAAKGLPKKGPVEVKPSEEKPEEVTGAVEEKPEEIKPEESETEKVKKPSIKRPPTEREKEKSKKKSADEKKSSESKQNKEIDLGRRHIKIKGTKTGKPPQSDEEGKVSKEKEVTTRVESPFVELDLDETKVFLVLPKQRFKLDYPINDVSQQISYRVQINGKEQTVPVEIFEDDKIFTKIEEKRIEIKESLRNLRVLFPDELQGKAKTYTYKHSNENFYAFVAIGNNRGRMYYLHNKDGDINPLPDRMVWLLIHEDFKLEIESNYLTEETWLWEKYRPFRVNLKGMNELVIKNTKTSKEYKLSCEPTFLIEGQVIEDDFKSEMPLLIGGSLKIKAPRENPYMWTVWIQNKIAGYQIITENWSGVEPLSLKLPDDLPCECGEFQVDICQQDTRIADETLFFRWLPFIELNYQKELIIPNPRQGHKSEFIKVNVSGEGWALSYGTDRKVGSIENNSYRIELRPEENTVRFSITKKGKPETDTKFQITIPRLKWKTSKQKAWNGRLQNIKRNELIHGKSIYLLICTNDFNNKYDLSAILETNGQRLQEGKFIRQGINYNLELNQFYDTIKQSKREILLNIKIWKAGSELVSNVVTLQFPAEFEFLRKKSRQKIQQEEPMPIFSYPMVKNGRGKKRRGKGFSRQEIIAVGIDRSNIRCLNISFDKRRKSSHDWNIKTLKSIIKENKHAH